MATRSLFALRTSVCVLAVLGSGWVASAGTTVLQQPGGYKMQVHRAYSAGAYGETIQVPTNGHDVLRSFGIYLNEVPNSVGNTVNLELYAWDGTKATGNALVNSVITISHDEAQSILTLPGNGLTLAAGQEYVMFVVPSPTTAIYLAAALGTVGYANGHGVTSSTNPADWTSAAWATNIDPAGHDSLFHYIWGPTVADQLGFQATFASAPLAVPPAGVPEPSTLFSAALGLCVFMTIVLRRKALAN